MKFWAGIAAFFTMAIGLVRERLTGKKLANQKNKIEDLENARDIENRVRDNRADRLRKHDDAGFRD
jgi:uncharacterized membrane-anchored protein YhcB (DUF1043 family)